MKARENARKAERSDPVPVTAPSSVQTAERILETSTETDFHALTHMSKVEFHGVGLSLLTALGSVVFRAGAKLGLFNIDVILITISCCAGNAMLSYISKSFNVSPAVVCRIVAQAIPLLAHVAKGLWMPKSPEMRQAGPCSPISQTAWLRLTQPLFASTTVDVDSRRRHYGG